MAAKKKRKKQSTKKSILPVIDPKFIKDNQVDLPTVTKLTEYEMNSWFDLGVSHEKQKDCKIKSNKRISETLRVERIDLFPDANQKVILLRWLEVYRRLYNLTITNRSKFMNKGYMIGYFKMRAMVKDDLLNPDSNLAKEIIDSDIPAHTLWNAVNDVKKSFVTAMANKKAGNIKSFRLRHKKLSNPIKTLVIEPGTFSKKENAFAIKVLGKIKSSKKFDVINHDCRLSYNANTGRFVLWKPYTKIVKTPKYKHSLIALDPGMRTFQTGYSPDGFCLKIGATKYKKAKESNTNKQNDKIKKDNNKIKYLLDKVKNVKRIPKRNHNKFLRRVREKITNMITDLHWKTANYLCKQFKTILVGNMSTTGIVKKERSVLNADSKTFCIQLSHYKFRERLLSKAAEHNVNCLIVDESYTTQTCGLCGVRNTNVGGSDIFRCVDDSCGFKYDRDYNAGRNIYLKALSNKKI